MGRPATGGEHIKEARQALAAARTADELRAAQAVLLPLELGLSLDDSTILRNNPLTSSFCKAVETEDDRRQRLAVLGIPTIRNRRDLCQHFVVSASLTEMAGADLAEKAGLLKEQMDMTKASGFSFVDLSADFAGIEFAKRVKRNPTELANLAKSFAVDDYVPKIDGLRDSVSAARFKSDFGSMQDAKFQAAYDAVWSRVRAMPVYADGKK